MNIKERLAQEIEAAKKRSFTDQMREIQFSKSYSKGKTAYYQGKIDDLIIEMTKKKGIADNWFVDGCNDIMRETYPYESWVEGVIQLNLKDRPEDEVWQEVRWFLQKYFLILEYEGYIPNKKQREKTEINPNLRLADVLIDGITVDMIKKLCKSPDDSHYIGLFLYTLNKIGYFGTVGIPNTTTLEIIGKELKVGFKWHKSYSRQPSYKYYDDIDKIPPPSTLK